jgi:predicted TIM-barrel fold metal-dependent hydrolase
MPEKMNRRKFFRNTALSTAGILMGSKFADLPARQAPAPTSHDLMKEVMKYQKIDAHEHVWEDGSNVDAQIDFADRLGIEKLAISRPLTQSTPKDATPEAFKEANDTILNAMKRHPDRYIGMMYVNPLYGKESLEEINRCIDLGMVGLKVYYQVKINSPLFYPIIEKFIDLKMIILMHAHCGLGVGGKRTKYGHIQPNASIPEDFVEAAQRYPEAMFQYAHTGGGGDWEYACKTMKDYPNIYVDTSGSNNAGNMINYVHKYLGEDRMLFGTDSSYYQGVGTILASNMNEAQKRKIFFENYNNILRKSGNHVD